MVQQVMFCISRFLKKDIFWIFLLRLAPNNYSCTIQPDTSTAVYSCLVVVLNLVVLVLFFFFFNRYNSRSGFCEQQFWKTYESDVSLLAKLYFVGLGFFSFFSWRSGHLICDFEMDTRVLLNSVCTYVYE